MSLHYWRYQLKPRSALNAVSGARPPEGVLLRVGEGFGCLQPWPELGDEPLDAHLAALLRGEPHHTPLVTGALECARTDGEARGMGKSLFRSPVPESHWLVRDGDDPGSAKSDGFQLAKIKAGRDRKRLFDRIDAWAKAGLRLRLDFNESIPAGEFLDLWQDLGEERRAAIDLVEDPEAWTEEGWAGLRRRGVPLAVDRDHLHRLRPGDVLVCKPARHGFARRRDTRFYITSNMDHAIGQLWAAAFASSAWESEERPPMLPCGLLTHRCFENDPFFERLRCDGPRLLPPGGTGLGFDDLLESLPWKRLT